MDNNIESNDGTKEKKAINVRLLYARYIGFVLIFEYLFICFTTGEIANPVVLYIAFWPVTLLYSFIFQTKVEIYVFEYNNISFWDTLFGLVIFIGMIPYAIKQKKVTKILLRLTVIYWFVSNLIILALLKAYFIPFNFKDFLNIIYDIIGLRS